MVNKNQLYYYAKHSNIIKNMYVFFGSAALKILGLFVKKDNNLVLFVANSGNSFSGSPYSIYEYMKKDEKYKSYRCMWAFNKPEQYSDMGIETVKFDTFKYFLASLRAKYWVTDNNIERSLKYKSRDTVFLNTWHGVALKKIGNDDANSGRYDYSYIDYLCVSGEHDKRVYTSALRANPNSFLECGMPRNDSLFSVTDEERNKIRSKLGIPEDKKIILYAPTWRDSQNKGESFDLRIPVNFAKWQEVLGKNYVLLFRAHDRTTKIMNVQFNEFIRDYSSYEPLNDLLIASDILITDYSSIVFDYSILEKPFICFGYDYDTYVKERGVYFDAEKVYSGGVLRTENQVLDRIINMDYKKEVAGTKKLKEDFMEYSHGNATKICTERLFGGQN